MAKKQLFRNVALERLSSPEQLDMLVRVTTPAAWYSLLVLAVLLVMTLFWGVYGNIPVKVKAQGILMREGGIMSVVTLGSGQVSEVVVEAGDNVRRGQVIARLSQPVLMDELRNTRSELDEFKAQHEQLNAFSARDLGYQIESLAAQKKSILTSINSLDKRADFVRGQLVNQEALLKKGLIVPSKVEKSRQDLSSILEQVTEQKITFEELTTKEYSLQNNHRQSVQNSEFRINTLERKIALMERSLAFDSRVVSKISGRVIEVLVSPGQVVSAGAAVVNMEFSERKLEALFYVSPTEGKKIRAGMEIDLVPSTVKKEEHGSVLGLVTYVSEYPATYDGMVRMLGNEQLASALSGEGAPMVIYADLIPDGNNISGFKWSSGSGPDTSLQAGTMCYGEVITENRRPLSFVIPYMKKTLGL